MATQNTGVNQSPEAAKWIALLGRRETPTDGVQDYCDCLANALARRGVRMETVRVDWAELGWRRALRQLREQSADWRGSWVVLQYTAMAWSRRGFPFGVLLVLSALRRSGLHCAVVFHEPHRQGGERWLDRLRGRCQEWVIRKLYSRAAKAIFLDPLENIGWLPTDETKAVFIPIGANIPEPPARELAPENKSADVKTVAVFCLSNRRYLSREVGDIAYAMRHVNQRGIKARVVFVGRGTSEAKAEIARLLDSEGVEVVNHGLQSADRVTRVLSAADAMLCVRGRLYMRRGSAIAGIACGLPIVGYAGETRGTPLEEAGVELVPYGDREALGEALAQVLIDPERQRRLSLRSLEAQQKYFSWDRIASSYVCAFQDAEAPAKLLIYSHDWAPAIGGISTYVMSLARGLATGLQDRTNVTIVTRTAAGNMDDGLLPFRVVRQPGLLRLFRLVKAADVVHLAGAAFLPLLFALLLRRPVVIEHDGYQAVCPNGLLIYGKERTVCPGYFMSGQYAKCIRCQSADLGYLGSIRATAVTHARRWLAKRATANVIPSRHVGKRASLPRSELIYHGVAEKTVQPMPPRSGKRSICFGFAGRLVPEKGVDILLRAAQELSKSESDFRIRIVGDGPERRRLETLAGDLDVARFVEFVGAVPANEVDASLSTSEAAVIPSTWEDVAPLVVPELMMQGRLLIASDIGGLGELVGDFGLRFPPGDARELASCMEYVIKNPERVKEMRERARMHARDAHSELRMAAAHARLYRDLVRGRSLRYSASA